MNLKKIYYLWIAGFALKVIGASWDASFHFKYLRDISQLPHVLNTIGFLIIIGLSIYLWKKEKPSERNYLKVTITGIILFLVAIPLDELWHRVYGIDLTTWSPSHFILYIATIIMVIGVILQASKDREQRLISKRFKTVVQIILFTILFEGFWFALLQQEQGIISYNLFNAGTPIVSQEILDLIKDPTDMTQVKQHVFGGAPDWLYGIYITFAAAFVFRLVKAFKLGRFSSTKIAVIYIAFRFIMDKIFMAADYPTSSIPYFILLAAFLFDILHKEPKEEKISIKNIINIIITSLAIAISTYGMAFVGDDIQVHPAISIEFIVWGLLTATLGSVIAYKLTTIGSKHKNANIWAPIKMF